MDDRDDEDKIATLLRRKPTAGDRAEMVYSLTVLEGPDRGATFRLDADRPSRVLIGQSPACDVRLTDRQVSRRHASLELGGDGVRLTDLESTNGTVVNGLAVVQLFLRGGEVIRMGDTVLRIDAAQPSTTSLPTATSFGRIVGASVEMRRLYSKCQRLAASDVTVIIEGETGTGKEVLAESLHEASPRAGGPFVVFDCTSVPPNLVESELFGHERGAFTGAVSTRRGVFEQAHGGTLLIDEIGDLEISLQAKLLRALERSEIRRVGGERWIKIDVRVLAATRRDLDREVQAGTFRDDLFFRLAVARIELPPLRSRRGDIGVLAQHFWREIGRRADDIPDELLQRFERESWPGNVRELSNAVARYLALGEVWGEGDGRGAERGKERDTLEAILALDLAFPRARDRMLAEFERRYVERVLAAHGGNIANAARASGIARRYFAIIAARHSRRPPPAG